MSTYTLHCKLTKSYILGSNDLEFIKNHLSNMLALSNSVFTFTLTKNDYIIYKNKGYKNELTINF